MKADESPYELGRQLVREMRLEGRVEGAASATHRLRWGNADLDDDGIMAAVLGALDEASSDDELWLLGDGFLSEIDYSSELERRLNELTRSDSRLRTVNRLVEERSLFWQDPEGEVWPGPAWDPRPPGEMERA